MGQICERSLMKMGNGGLVVSIPSGWARYYGLSAGDKVEVVSNGKTLPKRIDAQTRKTWQRTKIEPLVKSYLEEASRNDQNATGKQIRERVLERLHSEGLKMDVPGVRKIQDIAKEARGKRGIQLDDAWSLAVRIIWIPPDATGDLLAVWKYCLTAGRKFTIREAIWVARLRSALPAADPQRLYEVAVAYARLERAYEGKDLKPSTDLDAELAFQRDKGDLYEWEYSQAVLAGVVPISEGYANPRYIDAAPGFLAEDPYLKAVGIDSKPTRMPSYWPLPQDYFVRAVWSLLTVGHLLYGAKLLSTGEMKLLREGKLSWWPQAFSVIIFWLRKISNSVKKWQGIDKGYGGPGVPGDTEIAEWKDMARKLVSLVIQWVEILNAWQKWQAEDGDYEKLLAGLEGNQLPDIFKQFGRDRLKESQYEGQFLKNFLNNLGLDELGNPLKGGQDSEKEAS